MNVQILKYGKANEASAGLAFSCIIFYKYAIFAYIN